MHPTRGALGLGILGITISWAQSLPPDSLFVMQCSAGSRRFLRRPCSTERTEGLCTSCSTKRWDCRESRKLSVTHSSHTCPVCSICDPSCPMPKGLQDLNDASLGEGTPGQGRKRGSKSRMRPRTKRLGFEMTAYVRG